MTIKARALLRAIVHPVSVFQAKKVIELPTLSGLKETYPHLYFKITRRNLYQKSPCYSLKASIFCHHYKLLSRHFDQGFIDDSVKSEIIIWHHPSYPSIQIVWKQTLERNQDCEIDLILKIDNVNIYAMGIVFVPANSIVPGDEQGILISRIQSFKENGELFKQNKNKLSDVAPAHLLFSAIRGLADYLQCHKIYGISAKQQSYSKNSPQHNYLLNYDHFWEALSARKHKERCFIIDMPYVDKPITEVVQKHRGRTRKKRHLKQEIVTSVLATLKQFNPMQVPEGSQVDRGNSPLEGRAWHRNQFAMQQVPATSSPQN